MSMFCTNPDSYLGIRSCPIPRGFEISCNYIHFSSANSILSISCLEFVKTEKPSHSHARPTFTFYLKEKAALASLLRKTDAAEMA